jgi:hypothetical protein
MVPEALEDPAIATVGINRDERRVIHTIPCPGLSPVTAMMPLLEDLYQTPLCGRTILVLVL